MNTIKTIEKFIENELKTNESGILFIGKYEILVIAENENIINVVPNWFSKKLIQNQFNFDSDDELLSFMQRLHYDWELIERVADVMMKRAWKIYMDEYINGGYRNDQMDNL